jgi:hypothetical protein
MPVKRTTSAKKTLTKTTTPKAVKRAPARKRELNEPNPGDKRYVRRKGDGTFGKMADVGKSSAADQRRKAKKVVPKGQGDRGDTRRRK